MNVLQTADYIVFFIYFVIVTAYGMYIYRSKKTAATSSNEYFLAEGSLTWWAIGASLIASNISAEHFIGMSGSGFAIGLAIASYEWMSAATLIIVAMFILPIYLKNKIFTMPQFLAKRYSGTVSTIMAIIWLLIYVFVNLTSIIYLGALAISSIAPVSFQFCVMILDESNPHYNELPGMSVLVGGMLINNLAYWGCNQYIVQRALGADLKTARKGILFAAFLKLLVPIIAVLPGIAMFVMHQNGAFQQEMVDAAGVLKPDHAYPTLMNLLPAGLKGVALAALTAAIVASLAGKANSISTIFSLDIYKKYFNSQASEKKLVRTGRWCVVVCMIIAAFVAPALKTLDQAYQFIQEYVGFFSPGVLAIFLLGMFWKKTTPSAGLAGALLTVPIAAVLKFLPMWTEGAFPDYPFLDRMTIVFFMIVFIMVGISLAKPASEEESEIHKIEVDKSMFKVSSEFIVGSFIISGILVALYTVFW
jgi:uncharacterized sodium:solute symporter family permease YidK